VGHISIFNFAARSSLKFVFAAHYQNEFDSADINEWHSVLYT